ncbi:uncharacterized protein LY89DRAFT_673530 [Mollisia scopiformis]|uniref:Uncharacterized protein n=1 Tax=Mollisia scopiformis TaxID=149040 RepID=A0A194WXB7_MOLSC|nr:uncharacterized protein LY89DRAFT_673530 [Mollisia scopiformis]KUJ12575.1 hypothetical protein LY89DRAFT_673530 [Mollisia scopiformis]
MRERLAGVNLSQVEDFGSLYQGILTAQLLHLDHGWISEQWKLALTLQSFSPMRHGYRIVTIAEFWTTDEELRTCLLPFIQSHGSNSKLVVQVLSDLAQNYDIPSWLYKELLPLAFDVLDPEQMNSGQISNVICQMHKLGMRAECEYFISRITMKAVLGWAIDPAADSNSDEEADEAEQDSDGSIRGEEQNGESSGSDDSEAVDLEDDDNDGTDSNDDHADEDKQSQQEDDNDVAEERVLTKKDRKDAYTSFLSTLTKCVSMDSLSKAPFTKTMYRRILSLFVADHQNNKPQDHHFSYISVGCKPNVTELEDGTTVIKQNCPQCRTLDLSSLNTFLNQHSPTEVSLDLQLGQKGGSIRAERDHLRKWLVRDNPTGPHIKISTRMSQIKNGMLITKCDPVYDTKVREWQIAGAELKKQFSEIGEELLRHLLGKHFDAIMALKPIVLSDPVTVPKRPLQISNQVFEDEEPTRKRLKTSL